MPMSETSREFVLRFLGHGILGLIGGMLINHIFRILTEIFEEHFDSVSPYIQNQWLHHVVKCTIMFALAIVQLIAGALLLYVLMSYLPWSLHEFWQSSVPGLAFPSLYFGVQSTLFNNTKALTCSAQSLQDSMEGYKDSDQKTIMVE